LYHVPEIRAVIHLTGSAIETGSEGATQDTECEHTTTPVEGQVAPTPSPDLVWIPAAGATP
jgi:hypothetical protein